MLFSERLKLAKEVDDWFDEIDKPLIEEGSTTRIRRDTVNVITALEKLGYIAQDGGFNEDSPI